MVKLEKIVCFIFTLFIVYLINKQCLVEGIINLNSFTNCIDDPQWYTLDNSGNKNYCKDIGESASCYDMDPLQQEGWERCLKIEPNNIVCRENLTALMCAVKDINCKSMIDTLSMLNNGTVSTTLIVYLKELREYDLALKLLNNLALINPKDKEVLTLLSIIYSDTSAFNTNFSTKLAEKYFNDALSLYSNDVQLHYNFGKYQQDVLKYNEALKSYNHVINLDSTNKQAYYNMGFCAMQLENYTESIMYFTKAINLDQSFLLAYHARAFVNELNKDFDKAKVDWKNCLMLNPSYIPALEGLNK